MTACIKQPDIPSPHEPPLLPNLRVLNILVDSEPSFVPPADADLSRSGAPGRWLDDTRTMVKALVEAASTRCHSDTVGLGPLIRIRVNREALSLDSLPSCSGSPNHTHTPDHCWSHLELEGELLSSDGTECDDDSAAEGSEWEDSGSVGTDDPELDEEYHVLPEEEITYEELRALAWDIQVENPSWVPPPGSVSLSTRGPGTFAHVYPFLGSWAIIEGESVWVPFAKEGV